MYADPEAECQVGGSEDDLDEDDHEDGGDNDAFDAIQVFPSNIYKQYIYYVPS